MRINYNKYNSNFPKIKIRHKDHPMHGGHDREQNLYFIKNMVVFYLTK